MNEKEKHEQIPELIYKELIDLFGKAKTEDILKSKRTNFKYLKMKIMAAKFKKKYSISFWFILIVLVMWSIYYFFFQL